MQSIGPIGRVCLLLGDTAGLNFNTVVTNLGGGLYSLDKTTRTVLGVLGYLQSHNKLTLRIWTFRIVYRSR